MDKRERRPAFESSPLVEDVAVGNAKTAAADEISIKELILKLQEWYRYLLSKWVIIVITGIIGGGLGLAYAYSQKPLYTAELTFVLEGKNGGGSMGNYAGIASQLGINMGAGGGGGVFEGQNLFELIRSRLMVEKALMTTVNAKGKKETLAEYYIAMNGLREKWADKNPKFTDVRFLPGANPEKFSLEQNTLISEFHKALLKKNLFVDNKDKKSSIITMRVTSEDELFSKYFIEALLKEVSDFYIATKTKKSVKNLSILQFQVDSVRRQFNAAISGIAVSMDANPNANPARNTLQVPSQRRQVDAQANQVMLMELMKNLAISQISLREETPLIQMIDHPVLPLPSDESSKARGLIFGGILGVLIAVIVLIVRRLFTYIMT